MTNFINQYADIEQKQQTTFINNITQDRHVNSPIINESGEQLSMIMHEMMSNPQYTQLMISSNTSIDSKKLLENMLPSFDMYTGCKSQQNAMVDLTQSMGDFLNSYMVHSTECAVRFYSNSGNFKGDFLTYMMSNVSKKEGRKTLNDIYDQSQKILDVLGNSLKKMNDKKLNDYGRKKNGFRTRKNANNNFISNLVPAYNIQNQVEKAQNARRIYKYSIDNEVGYTVNSVGQPCVSVSNNFKVDNDQGDIYNLIKVDFYRGKLYCCRDFYIYFDDYNSGKKVDIYLLSNDQLIELRDISLMLMSTRLHLYQLDYTDPKFINRYDIFNKYYMHFVEYIKRYKMSGYNIVGNVETLIVMTKLFESERTYYRHSLYESTFEAVKESFEKVKKLYDKIDPTYEANKLIAFNKYIHHKCKAYSSFFWELHGLYRTWGHPLVDVRKSAEKTRKVCTALKTDNFDETVSCLASGMQKKLIMQAYVNKHGRMPRTLPFRRGHVWRPAIHGRKELTEYIRNLPVEFFTEVVLYDIEELIDDPDMNRFVKDKSISIAKDKVNCVFSPQKMKETNAILNPGFQIILDKLRTKDDFYFSYHGKQVNKESSEDREKGERKLVIKHLKTQDDYYVKIIKQFKKGNLSVFDTRNWLILMTCKERELKEAARLFGVTFFELRSIITYGEYHIKKNIMKYIEDTTMTLDGIGYKKRMEQFTNPKSIAEGYKAYYLSTDFEKWNLNFTEINTADGFRTIDEMCCSDKFFRITHQALSLCTFMTANRDVPYEVLNNDGTDPNNLKWGGEGCESGTLHVGGVEGLRQKCWSLITISLLRLAAEQTGTNVDMITQGDNCIIKLIVSKNNDYIDTDKGTRNTEVDNYLDRLVHLCGKMEINLKKTESYISDSFIIYSKNLIQDGQFHPQIIKKVSRALIPENAPYTTLKNQVSTAISAYSASIEIGGEQYALLQSLFFNLTLMITRYFTQNYTTPYKMSDSLKNDLFVKYGTPVTNFEDMNLLPFDFMELLIFGGNEIGFLPCYNHFNLMVTGVADKLGNSVEQWKMIDESEKDSLFKKLYNHAMNSNNYDTTYDIINLLIGDDSLPIKHISQLNSVFSKNIERYIRDITERTEVKAALNQDDEIDKKYFRQILKTMKPCLPKVMSYLYDLSPTGRKQELLNLLTKSNTIKEYLYYDESLDKNITRWYIYEKYFLYWRYNQVKKEPIKYDFNNCSTEAADDIRRSAYVLTRLLNNDLMVTPLTPNCSISGIYVDEEPQEANYSAVIVDKRKLIDDDGSYIQVDSSEAHYSSTTKVKTKLKYGTVGMDYEPVKNIMTNLNALNLALRNMYWCNSDGVFPNTLQSSMMNRIFTYTDLSGEMFDIIEISVSGDMYHRAETRYAKVSVSYPYNYMYTVLMKYGGEKLGYGIGGSTSFNINYSQFKFHIYSWITENILLNDNYKYNQEYVVYFTVGSCQCAKELPPNVYNIYDTSELPHEDSDVPVLKVDEKVRQVYDKSIINYETNVSKSLNQIDRMSISKNELTDRSFYAMLTAISVKINKHLLKIKDGKHYINTEVTMRAKLSGDLKVKYFQQTSFVNLIRHMAFENLIEYTMSYIDTLALQYKNRGHSVLNMYMFKPPCLQLIDYSWSAVINQILEYPSALVQFYNEYKELFGNVPFIKLQKQLSQYQNKIATEYLLQILQDRDLLNRKFRSYIFYAKSNGYKNACTYRTVLTHYCLYNFWNERREVELIIPRSYIRYHEERANELIFHDVQENSDHATFIYTFILYTKFKYSNSLMCSFETVREKCEPRIMNYLDTFDLFNKITDAGITWSFIHMEPDRIELISKIFESNIYHYDKVSLQNYLMTMQEIRRITICKKTKLTSLFSYDEHINYKDNDMSDYIDLVKYYRSPVSKKTIVTGNNRKGHIFESHIYRHLGETSQSSYKYLDLLHKDYDGYSRYLFLAEGRGSIAAQFCGLYDNIKILFYTLNFNEALKMKDFEQDLPAELNNIVCYPKILNKDSITKRINDLSRYSTVKKILYDINTRYKQFDNKKLHIMSDLEITMGQNIINYMDASINILYLVYMLNQSNDIYFTTKLYMTSRQTVLVYLFYLDLMFPSLYEIILTPFCEYVNLEYIVRIVSKKRVTQPLYTEFIYQSVTGPNYYVFDNTYPVLEDIITDPNHTCNPLMVEMLNNNFISSRLMLFKPSGYDFLEYKFGSSQYFYQLEVYGYNYSLDLEKIRSKLWKNSEIAWDHYISTRVYNKRSYYFEMILLSVDLYMTIREYSINKKLKHNQYPYITVNVYNKLILDTINKMNRRVKPFLISKGRDLIEFFNTVCHIFRVRILPGYLNNIHDDIKKIKSELDANKVQIKTMGSYNYPKSYSYLLNLRSYLHRYVYNTTLINHGTHIDDIKINEGASIYIIWTISYQVIKHYTILQKYRMYDIFSGTGGYERAVRRTENLNAILDFDSNDKFIDIHDLKLYSEYHIIIFDAPWRLYSEGSHTYNPKKLINDLQNYRQDRIHPNPLFIAVVSGLGSDLDHPNNFIDYYELLNLGMRVMLFKVV